MYTKEKIIELLSNKKEGELVTIEFTNDVELNEKAKGTKRTNIFYKKVKKYHKLKCLTTYDYEKEKIKRCAEYGKQYNGIKGESWGESININPHIIQYMKDGHEYYYLQVIPKELVDYYYQLNDQKINEDILKPYLPQKSNNRIVIRIKLEDINSIY